MSMKPAARKRRGLAKAPGKGRPYGLGKGNDCNAGTVPSVSVSVNCGRC